MMSSMAADFFIIRRMSLAVMATPQATSLVVVTKSQPPSLFQEVFRCHRDAFIHCQGGNLISAPSSGFLQVTPQTISSTLKNTMASLRMS